MSGLILRLALKNAFSQNALRISINDAVCYKGLLASNSLRNPFDLQVRFKGHSKWQNIKHIKAANDMRIGNMCNKYAHLIGIAIRDNGMEKNPEFNVVLRKVIANARSEDVPKSTIENAIKKATTAQDLQEIIIEMLGPGRCLVVIEILAKNRSEADRVIRSATKKIGGAFEKNILKMFEKKAILTAKAPEPDWSLDRAENDAIESGAEEVELVEQVEDANPENPVFQFTCGPYDLATVRSMLSEHQYEVLSAGIYYIPNCYCSIDNEKESIAAEAFIKALESCPGVTGVHHNLA